MDNTICIKPHHLLDIFKLYGKGLNIFKQDRKYNHDFYKIGNQVISAKVIKVVFTIEADMICTPCNYCKDNRCCDIFIQNGISNLKDNYNKKLDCILLKFFQLDENIAYNFIDIVNLLASELTLDIINNTWKNCSKSDNEDRFYFTITGIHKMQKIISKIQSNFIYMHG